jgi:hypothetical protein
VARALERAARSVARAGGRAGREAGAVGVLVVLAVCGALRCLLRPRLVFSARRVVVLIFFAGTFFGLGKNAPRAAVRLNFPRWKGGGYYIFMFWYNFGL